MSRWSERPAADEMRGPEAWQLAVMRANGREAEAQAWLDEINRCRRICGAPEYAMPEPATTGLPDVVTCSAVPYSRVSFDTAPDNGRARFAA